MNISGFRFYFPSSSEEEGIQGWSCVVKNGQDGILL